METCYKAVRTSLLKSIPIDSNDFRLEPELTIKLAKRQARLFEIPISYSGRTYQEGKKINWRDGVAALLGHPPVRAVGRHLQARRVRQPDPGPAVAARRDFNAWMADTIRPFCGQRVLEIGSGVGNLTQQLDPAPRVRGVGHQPALPADAGGSLRQRPAVPAVAATAT